MPTPEEIIVRKERRELQAADGKIAMAEYLAEPDQRAALTVKLRAARLEAEAVAAMVPPVKKVRKRAV